jgi:hypothetical protein
VLKFQENEMGRACGTYVGEGKCIQFWWGNLWETDHLEDLGIDGQMKLKCVFKK